MSQRAGSRFWIVPAVWALIVTTLVGTGLARLSWPFVDLYNNFSKATSMSWRATLGYAFGGGVEYRPLLIVGVKLAHQLAGLRAWFYKALVLLQFAAILAALLWIFQPLTRKRALAACVALACLAGLHTSRVLFMFAPLNAHSLGVLLLLAGVILALSPASRINEWLFLPLTLVALLLLESGGLIVAVTLVLWRMRAPGATGRAVTATLAAAAVYLAVRFGLGAQVAASTYTETGLGFADVSAARLGEIFGHAPWLLWIYNVAASVLTIAASEPRAGKYVFIEAILHGNVPLWMAIHVLSSVMTTAVVVYALATSRIAIARDRQIAAAALTIVILGSALGFLYTRDRIALSAGVGYAMLVYVAIAAVLEGRPLPDLALKGRPEDRPLPDLALKGRPEGRPLSDLALKGRPEGRPLPEGAAMSRGRVRPFFATVCIGVIAAGWLVRTGESYLQLRDAGWENYQEWTARYEELGGLTRPQTDVLEMLRRDALAHLPDDPRNDPVWTYYLFEREFERKR